MSIDNVQANYNELAQIATRFLNLTDSGEDLYRLLAARVARLEDGGWIGRGADAFFAEMHGEVLPAQKRMGEVLRSAADATHEIARLLVEAEEKAAQLFGSEGGDGDAGGDSTSGGITGAVASGVPNDKGTPREMVQLIDLLNLRENPITIIRNGDGEYLVLLKGTNPSDMAPGNNWVSAFASGNEVTSTYEVQVRAAIEKVVPPGATIHFVGHSQGGIVSHNLVDNASFRERYKIESVTTIGASQSAPMRDGIEYHRYANSTDPVPYADGGLLGNIMCGGDISDDLRERQSMTPLDSGHHFFDAHDTNSYIAGLKKTGERSPSSINLSAWSGAKQVASVSTDMGGAKGGELMWIDRGYDTWRTLPLMIMNHKAEHFTKHLPLEIRDRVDRVTDWVSDTVMSMPTPSQTLHGIVDFTGNMYKAGSSFFDRIF